MVFAGWIHLNGNIMLICKWIDLEKTYIYIYSYIIYIYIYIHIYNTDVSSKWKFLRPPYLSKITGPDIKGTSKAKHPNIAHRF